MSLDDLFRQGLQSTLEAEPPADSWAKIAEAVRERRSVTASPVHTEGIRWPKPIEFIKRILHRRRVASLAYGFNSSYPPSVSDLRCGGPRGSCRPSPFAGVFATELLELRLAS
jgi:hypothetical protein